MLTTMQPRVMRVGDLDIHVRVSDRRRSIRLTVERDATVTAIIPPATDEANLAKVITAKRPWLYAKLRDRAALGEPRPPREYVTGEGFPYLGRSYRSSDRGRSTPARSAEPRTARATTGRRRRCPLPAHPLVPAGRR